jgi:hypothetical protein
MPFVSPFLLVCDYDDNDDDDGYDVDNADDRH